MLVHNNYYRCYYNNNPAHILKTNLHDKWGIHFNFSVMERRPVMSFKQELLNSCRLMYEDLKHHTPILNVFLSGGTDSECLVRCFHEAGIPIRPLIIRHLAAPKSDETIIALDLCHELNLHPLVFDIDLFHLHKMGVLADLAIKYQTYYIAMTELLYVMEIVKEPVILGDEIKLERFTNSGNIIKRDEFNYNEWYFYVEEDLDGVFSRYMELTDIPVITDSFKYTPQTWAAMISAPDIQKIVLTPSGKVSGKTTKNRMMSREFGVRLRKKTNVFSEGPYISILQDLSKILSLELYPCSNIYLEYTELLTLLDSGER